jgi:hypothetical protein
MLRLRGITGAMFSPTRPERRVPIVHVRFDAVQHLQRGRGAGAQSAEKPRFACRVAAEARLPDLRVAIQERIDGAKHLFMGRNVHGRIGCGIYI